MSEKRTMTLNLTEREMAAVEALASSKGLSKTGVIKQALRLYQSLNVKFENGEKLYTEDPFTREKSELMLL